VLRFLCEYDLCGWSVLYDKYIGDVLPLPSRDKFSTVRSGDAFLSAEEEASIIRHLDKLAERTKANPEIIPVSTLQTAGMLISAYQFAMRPVQIAMVGKRDVRIWQDSEEGPPSVHITFKMVKQRSRRFNKPMTRRVKQEWAPIIVELVRRLSSNNSMMDSRLFGVESSGEAGNHIKGIASIITHSDVSAIDLRHTAAQRLADAGASQEELAEFLGHVDSRTCLVYFRTSYNQTERVNRAFGQSTIYRNILKIARDKVITPKQLAKLKGDQQVAGVPYGIPIAGIGGCASGQPACSLNPVTSCYTCPKFLPVNDIHVHQQVLDEFLGVVNTFWHFSRGEAKTPAYYQLNNTISGINAVIATLQGESQ
jgi:hypothetical protein